MNESTELERVWGSSSSCRAAPPILELDIIQVRVAWWVETWISHVKQNKESLSIISSLFVCLFLSPSSLKVLLPDSTLLLPTLHWMLLYLHRKSPGWVHRSVVSSSISLLSVDQQSASDEWSNMKCFLSLLPLLLLLIHSARSDFSVTRPSRTGNVQGTND